MLCCTGCFRSAYLLSFTFVCIIFVLLPRSNAANHSKHGSPLRPQHCTVRRRVFYVCELLWSITVPVSHRNFGFLNFIVDISVILRYDSHKVQNFTEYWNDRFFAILLLFCIMPKSAAAGLCFTFRISFSNIVHLP